MPISKRLLTIKEASDFLKVSTKTLRRWEKRGLLIPIRTSGGHRRYQSDEIISFKKGKLKQKLAYHPAFDLPTHTSKQDQSIILPSILTQISEVQTDKDEEKLVRSLKPILKIHKKIISALILIIFITTIVLFSAKNKLVDLKQIVRNVSTIKNESPQIEALKEKITKEQTEEDVLAASSFQNINFRINVDAIFTEDLSVNGVLSLGGNTINSTDDLLINPGGGGASIGDGAATIDLAGGDLFVTDELEVEADAQIGGNLNISGTTLSSTGDLVVDPGGGGLSIGTGTAGSVDLTGDDLYITGDLEADGSSYIPTLVIGSDTVTDITGSGIQVSSGNLQATLGTSISSSEIEDDTILEVDLKVSNSPTNAYLLSYNSSTGGFTWISTSSTRGIDTVQESDVTINSTTATTIDFLGGDFDLNESPAGELNIQLATTLASVTGVAANFDVAGQLVVGTSDAATITSAGEIQIPATQTLQIGTIELNDVGTDNLTSGAVLIGAFDEFANSSATNLQDILDDLDAAIGSGASKWTQATGFIYLTNTTDDVVIGGTTVAAANFFFDESASNLFIGTNESANGILTLYSSGVGITDASITTDSAGRLIIDSTNFDVTSTGINATAIGQTTTAAANFTTLGASSTVTFSNLTTAGPVITSALGVLSSEATLALTRGGTGRSITASNGQVVYSDADSFELTISGTTDQCLKFQSASAPIWAECVTSSQVPFQSSGGVITKLTAADYLSLRYGDAADTQLEIQNTTTGTIPTADAVAINLTGGTTGIVTDAADALFIAAEFGDEGTNQVNSLLHLDLDPVAIATSDDTFYAINIDGLTGTSATEIAANFGSGWDREINFADTSPTISIANTGTLSVTDGANTLFSIADDTSEGDVTVTGDLAINGATSADITSTTTTASVFNTTVTTLNIGGAATTLNLADAAVIGTIDIGGVTADGATTVNIATQSTSADTIAIGNSNAATTLALTGGDDWNISTTGILTLSASSAQTTAIVANDTDYTNFADIGDNDITGTTFDLIGTTATINFTDFDVDADGNVTLGPDAVSDALSITLPNAASRAIVVDAATNNNTLNQTAQGVLNLAIDADITAASATNNGVYIDYETIDDTDATDTFRALRLDFLNSSEDAGDATQGISIRNVNNISATAVATDALIALDNADATASSLTDGILITATGVNDGIVDAIDVSDGNITNALNIGANAIAGTNFSVSAAGTITIASGQTLTIGATSLNETTSATDSGGFLVGVFDEFTNSANTNVQAVLNDLDAAIGAGSSKWTINTTPTPDVIYPTASDTPAGNDLAIGGTTITAAPFAVDISANTIYVGDAATAGSTSVIFKSDAGADTGTLAYNTSDQFEFSGGNLYFALNVTSLLFEGSVDDANDTTISIVNPSAARTINVPNNGGTFAVAASAPIELSSDGIISCSTCTTGGSTKWTDGGAITYLTATTDDLAVGASNTLVAPWSVDVSANTVRIGDATVAGSAILSLYASDGDTGNLTYNTSDQFQFSGGDVLIDLDLRFSGSTPSIILIDSDVTSDDYSINVDANVFNIVNDTDIRTELSFAGDGGIDIGDNTATKTIDIGGVTASASDTINVATNSTTNDTIAIGNANASTTVAITGGDDWSITAAGALDINGLFTLGDSGDTGAIDTSDWDINTTGDMTGIGAITADGAISFTPGSTSDIVFNGDVDSNFQIASTIASDATLNVVDITLTASGTGSTNVLNGLAITNAATAGTTTPDSLIYLAQLDTDETVTNGMFIENNAGGTLTNAIRIAETAGTITDGILVSGTLANILNTDTIDISGGGAITGATAITSSGTITFSGLATNGPVYTTAGGVLNSEAQLALSRGGTNRSITASNGAVVYSDADSFELTAVGSTGQCLTSNGAAAPTWTACDSAATTPFTVSGGIIDKTTVTDRLRLLYGDAGDVQLTIENTTNSTIPTADAFAIDLTGGTTGIITDGADGLFIATEFGDNVGASTRSALHLDVNPVDTPTSDDTFYAINIDSLTPDASVENAINIGAGWDRAIIIDAAATDSSLAGATSGIIQLTADANPAAASTNQAIYLDYETIDDANADQTFRAARIDFLNSSEDAADTTYALSISNSNNASATAVATDALIQLDNADATAASLTDAIVITSSGVADGITDAIDVSAANLNNGINFGGNFALFDGVRQFSPSSGTWTLEDTSGNDLISAVDAGAITIGSSAVGTTAITLATDGTGDAEVALPTGSISGTEILDDTVTLTTDTNGNYVATITAGNGISGASSTEGGTPTIALASLTSNWSQTGAFDIVLNNASSELVFLESAGATFFGTLDVGDLDADKTYTLPNFTGSSATICLSTGNCSGAGSSITGSGTAGEVAFFDAAQNIVSENNLEWDATNNVLSLGTGTAAADTAALLDIFGESEYAVLRPADIAADADTNNSPILRLRGTYDSDAAVGPFTSSNFNFDLRNIMTAAGASPASRLDFLNNSGAQVLSLSSAGVLTIPGSADGTDALVLTAGDILISNGDLDLSGGDFNVTLDTADGASITSASAATADTLTLTSTGVGSDALQITYTQSDDADATDTTAGITISPISSSGDADTFLGIDIANLTAGTATETAIRVGTGWDGDISFVDTTAVIALTGTDGQLDITDGTNNLFRVDDTGSVSTVSLPTNASLFDLAAITHASSASQGVRLPQAATLTAITGGTEGYIAWDSDDNLLQVFDGTTWTSVSGGASTTLQQAYDNDVNGGNATITLTANDDGIVFTNPDVTGNDLSAFVFQINQSDTDAAVAALDITQVSTNAAASAINITSSAATTSNIIAFDNTGNAAWTGNIFDVTTGTGNYSGNIFDVNLEASTNNDGQVLVVNNADESDQAGWLMDIDTSAAWTANMIDITTGAQATTGNFIDINLGNAAHTGDVINIDIPANAVAAQALVLSDAAAATVNLVDLSASAITTGRILNVSSTTTSTSFSGMLGNFDWSPGLATTATGNLLTVNIGTNGTTTGDLFQVQDASSDLFRVNETIITSALPHEFTAAGDVSVAYDLAFTNQTASTIKANGPLKIEQGESSESNNLTLQVYNAASVIVDGSTDVNTGTGGVLDINVNSITANNVGFREDYTVNTGVTATDNLYAGQINLQQDDADADLYGMFINLNSTAVTIAGTNLLECFLCLENDEAQVASVANAIWITSTAATAGSITNGINFDTTDITTDIVLQNDETIDNDTNGTVDISGELVIFLDGDAVTSQGLCGNQGAGDVADTDNIRISDCSSAPGDYAEWYAAEFGVEPGDLVAISTQSFQYESEGSDPITGQVVTLGTKKVNILKKAQIGDKVLGIVSTAPYEVIGEDIKKAVDASANPNIVAVPITLSGRVPIKISSTSATINAGDYITISQETGTAQKAVASGVVIGQALSDWTHESGQETVMAFVTNAFYFTDNSLDSNGDIQLAQDLNSSDYYQLKDKDGKLIDKLSGLVSLIVGNIKAGAIEVSQLVSKSIKTQEIAPVEGEKDVAIKIGDSTSTSLSASGSSIGSEPSGFGKLLVQNRAGETVAEIDEAGNATFSGQLASDSLQTNDASIAGELKVRKIYADEIVSNSLTTNLTLEQIETLLKEAEGDQALLTESQSWPVSATQSASLNELALENLYVAGTAALNSLSVTESIVLGTDLVISPSLLATSLDTVQAPLSIQSSASQPLYIMAGLVTIDTQGNVQIAGNLAVDGTIQSSSLKLKENPDVSNQSISEVSQVDTSGFGKLLALYNKEGQEVAAISATGSARFNEVAAAAAKLVSLETDKITITDDPNATASASFAGMIYHSQASAGSAKVPAGSREVIIRNPNIKDNSLVFITPTSKTASILFVKDQFEGEIIVGFDVPTTQEVNFNWWIVDRMSEAQ